VVTARNPATGASRSIATDDAGRYSLANLEPGTYEVRGEHAGFTTAVASGIVLNVAGTQVLDLVLSLAAVAEGRALRTVKESPESHEAGARLSGRAIESLSIAVHEVCDPHVADVFHPREVDLSSVGGQSELLEAAPTPRQVGDGSCRARVRHDLPNIPGTAVAVSGNVQPTAVGREASDTVIEGAESFRIPPSGGDTREADTFVEDNPSSIG
jgi:Carboxypeptidase regulatory-like domain